MVEPSKPETKMLTRLTLFPPQGKRIDFFLEEYRFDEDHVLRFTGIDGIKYETTVRFAIEHIHEGQPAKTPFWEK